METQTTLTKPPITVRTMFRELGVGGVAFMALFWCLVPFARIYFYFRDVATGRDPMTGFPTSRLLLAFPFERGARSLRARQQRIQNSLDKV